MSAEWRPMATAPKEEGKQILAISSGRYVVIEWIIGKWYDGDMYSDDDAFDYWMSLPDPPNA